MENTNSVKEVCLLNDSFPPIIDGVANAVINYAKVIKKNGIDVSVVTPECPGAEDEKFDFSVFRYPSIDTRKLVGYTAGNPFDISTMRELKKHDISLLHSHCPATSNIFARWLRESIDVPFIMTYHTNYDVAVADAVKSKLVQDRVIRALIASASACDELWVVSEGAGRNIQNLGYEGDYIVMENGVDMPRHRVADELVAQAANGYDLPSDVPVFLFVGRLMWYKGIRLIIDALAALKSQHMDFRMVFIGGGGDEKNIKIYTEYKKLGDKCFFTGPIYDREQLAAWYCRADLFLFPSTFDTNGLVVREAAACSLASVLVDGSCAAEGITDGYNGFLIEENAASLAVCLSRIMENKELMHKVGDQASDSIYISWDQSVGKAIERYKVVIDNYRSGYYAKKRKFADDIFSFAGDIIEIADKAQRRQAELTERLNRID